MTGFSRVLAIVTKPAAAPKNRWSNAVEMLESAPHQAG
jgi:hypothetical protein